jgi:hypothetical protein
MRALLLPVALGLAFAVPLVQAEPRATPPKPVANAQVPEPKADPRAVPTPTPAPARPAAASAPVTTASIATAPASVANAILFEETGKSFCIGGTECPAHCEKDKSCEARAVYTIKLPEPRRITGIQVFAHDQVGAVRRADLVFKVNGEVVGRGDVFRNGSVVGIRTARTGQIVTIEAVHHANGHLNGGDEAVIRDIYLFGSKP